MISTFFIQLNQHQPPNSFFGFETIQKYAAAILNAAADLSDRELKIIAMTEGKTHLVVQHDGPVFHVPIPNISIDEHYVMPPRLEQMFTNYAAKRNAGEASARLCTEAMYDESAEWCENVFNQEEENVV